MRPVEALTQAQVRPAPPCTQSASHQNASSCMRTCNWRAAWIVCCMTLQAHFAVSCMDCLWERCHDLMMELVGLRLVLQGQRQMIVFEHPMALGLCRSTNCRMH